MVPFPCPFFPAGGREKTGHRNGSVGRVPTPSACSFETADPRGPGALWSSTAGCRVVDFPAVSSPLLLLKPAACLPSFSDVQDCTAPCRLDVDVSLMCLAMKNRPVFVTWFLFTNLGLTYNIQRKL